MQGLHVRPVIARGEGAGARADALGRAINSWFNACTTEKRFGRS
jgi:hypothetical protein